MAQEICTIVDSYIDKFDASVNALLMQGWEFRGKPYISHTATFVGTEAIVTMILAQVMVRTRTEE